MKARLIFEKKELYPDGSLTEIRIWQVGKSKTFPLGIKYAFYFIGPGPSREILVGYDNHHGKGDHKHFQGVESPVAASSVSELLKRFRREVSEHLQKQGIKMKGEV